MKRYIGYLLIVAGFLLVAVGLSSSSGVVSNFVSIPLPSAVSNILGIILVAAGLYFSWDKKKSTDHPHGEVPIYEGEGKKRRIVGYRKISNP
jgi:hypothetical protein